MSILLSILVALLNILSSMGGTTNYPAQSSSYKDQLSKILASTQQFAANNNGKMPTSTDWKIFASTYLESADDDWKINYSNPLFDALPKKVGDVSYLVGYACDGEEMSKKATSDRMIALFVKLNQGKLFCLDNQ